MSQRVGVAIVHGVGVQGSDFAEPMIRELTDRFANELDISRAEAAGELGLAHAGGLAGAGEPVAEGRG